MGDVGNESDVQRMVDEAIDTFGRVDVLVNNAAAPHGLDRDWAWKVPQEAWDEVFTRQCAGDVPDERDGRPQHARAPVSGADHQYRLDSGTACVHTSLCLLCVQVRSNWTHTGDGPRVSPLRHHRKCGLPRGDGDRTCSIARREQNWRRTSFLRRLRWSGGKGCPMILGGQSHSWLTQRPILLPANRLWSPAAT